MLYEQSLIGCINYTNIIKGPLWRAIWIFRLIRTLRERDMFSSLEQTLDDVKSELHPHRVMANYMHNQKSERLLTRLNFKTEGYAEAYLKING
jgi:RimJ/RimL family protein N-acetyltransferase